MAIFDVDDSTMDLLEELRALRERVAAMDWRPIETAPCGVDVLVFFPNLSADYQIMICHRFDETAAEWYQQDADQCPAPMEDAPTHWRLLPAPPADGDHRSVDR